MKKNLIQICLMLAVCCARGQGTFVYDQQSATTDGGAGGITVIVQSNEPIGQSFVPGLPAVGFIRLFFGDPVAGGVGATNYVNLWAGSLTNGILLGTSLPVAIPYTFVGVTNFFFSTPVVVTVGTTYYFQPVVQAGGDSLDTGLTFGTAYSNGTAFIQGAPNSNFDIWFREGIVVPEPSSGLLALLGVAGIYFQRWKNHKN